MKNKIIIILFLLTIMNVHSQNINVTYRAYVNADDPILSTSVVYNLILENYQSVYFNNNDSLKQFKYQSFIEETKKIGKLTRVKLSDNHYAFIKQDFMYKNSLLSDKKLREGRNKSPFFKI